MRSLLAVFAIAITLPLSAQPSTRGRTGFFTQRAQAAESVVRQAGEQLGRDRKTYERDIDVLSHLRAADTALADTMQPSKAVEKAYEEIEAAKRLVPDFTVMQGLIRAEREAEAARRSPGSTDFEHLRVVIRREALGPAARVVIRNVTALQDETLAWMKVQELIATQLRTLSEISVDSLRAAEQ